MNTTPETSLPDLQPQAATRLDLDVHGMHCGGCVDGVERALRGVPGVRDARVNLGTGRAVVELTSPRPGAAAALIAAVTRAGFQAEPHVPARGAVEQRRRQRSAELARRRRRLAVGLAAGVPALLAHWLGHRMGLPHGLAWALEGGLALIVLIAAAGEMLVGAARSLARRQANMDLLVALGAGTAFVTGWFGVALGAGQLVMFHAAIMIVLFVAIGKYFEARARGQASSALEALMTRIPPDALRVTGGAAQRVPIDDVQVGDALRLVPHAPAPVDGEVIDGRVVVDESMLTGESMPVERGPGQRVLGGTRVVDGQADIRATAGGADSAAARIARLVERAQEAKPPWQRLADRAAGLFVPVVVGVALATFGGWWLLGDAGPFYALQRAIAVLVIACPCAMGLAVPTAVLVGTSRAAAAGMLVRDAGALEAAAGIREVLLDKTGTLTVGAPALTQAQVYDGADDATVLRLAAAVGRHDEHPLARAIVRAAEQRGLALADAAALRSRAGGGRAGVVEGRRVAVGTRDWLREQGALDSGADPPPADAPGGVADAEGSGAPGGAADAEKSGGDSVVYVALDGRLVAALGFSDPLHAEAGAAVRELRALGARVRLLSGDRAPAVRAVAAQLGIDDWEAQLSPADKLARVRERGGRGVAMVGDGINDAPALAAADVGIAIGTGADVARESADICLLGHSPLLIPRAVRMSRVSARVMKQNLFWAVAYNAIMLPVAMFTPIPPAAATAAMMFSSFSVVANSLRLRRLI